jgi:hypothetical protein
MASRIPTLPRDSHVQSHAAIHKNKLCDTHAARVARAIAGGWTRPKPASVRFPGGQFIQRLSACQRPMEERRSAPSYLQEAASHARAAGKGQRCCSSRGIRCRRSPGAQGNRAGAVYLRAPSWIAARLCPTLRRGHASIRDGRTASNRLDPNPRGAVFESRPEASMRRCDWLTVTGGDSC